jgi:AcrR family transcriptional regulator
MTESPARPRRSDATREAILVAARERFATDGYARATIRAIAKDVGIDPSMVMRYYGNKEGLFAAASELDLRLPEPSEVPDARIGELLVGHFLSRWEQDGALAAMLRVGVTDEAGAARLRQTLAEQLGPFVAAKCPVPKQAPKRATLVASQMLGLALCRYVVLMPPAAAMSRKEIIAWLGPTVQRYVTAEVPS